MYALSGGVVTLMSGGRLDERAKTMPPQAMAGDLTGFVAMYEQGYARLVAQLSPVTGSVAEAEDVVQEAFVRAAQRWESLASYDAPEAWVRRVAINLALSSLRRARRATRVFAVWGRELDPGESDGPEAGDLERFALVAALQRLPMRYRVVLTLHYLVDLDVKGIARELAIPEPTVKTRLVRGRARLRELLESSADHEDSATTASPTATALMRGASA